MSLYGTRFMKFLLSLTGRQNECFLILRLYPVLDFMGNSLYETQRRHWGAGGGGRRPLPKKKKKRKKKRKKRKKEKKDKKKEENYE